MVFHIRLREPHGNFNDNQVVVLLVRVSAVTVSPSVILGIMLTEEVAMAACSRDMHGYLYRS